MASAAFEVDPRRSGSAPSARSESAAYPIRRVGVLGAGTMGSRIAAHIANAGFPVLLLDLPSEPLRNSITINSIKALRETKPPAFVDAIAASAIETGNFEDDLPKLALCDWVIEAVAEDLEIKRGLLRRVADHLHANAILTTNTSGLPVAAIAEELPAGLRRRCFGTHFFNPPRYMRLLEVIPGEETGSAAIASISRFADLHLGKTVVLAKDRPNFIANRIGIFVMLNTFRIMRRLGLTVEEVDALTGPPIGWPKSGTFRLADMVGIDVLAKVALNFAGYANSGDAGRVIEERGDVTLPPEIEEMIRRGWLGDKAGQGFYKKAESPRTASPEERKERLVLDLATLEYRPAKKPMLAALETAKSIRNTAKRIPLLLAGDVAKDKSAAFYRELLPQLWSYAAHRIGEVSDSLADVDCAMRAGFNWELGPFEMWDAAGVERTLPLLRSQGGASPPGLERLLSAGGAGWYRNGAADYFDPASGEYRPAARREGRLTVAGAKLARQEVSGNPSASLIDLGEGIACIEFHSKMNCLGQDIVSFLCQTLAPESEAVRDFQGFVIGNDAANFSVGANLMQLLLAAQDEEWDEIGHYIGAFQKMTQAIKFCPRPVVAAPFAMCLGGGTEICMHSSRRQAHVELYMGLVETGVGLLPAGGGCKETTLRLASPEPAPMARPDSVEIYDRFKAAFETIAMAKVSGSAQEARSMGLLSGCDGISMNRDRLLHDARMQAAQMAASGYAPPRPRLIPAPGNSLLAALKMGVHLLREGSRITDHDAHVAGRLAGVLCGGDVTAGAPLTEQYLLDLEREAFLSLCGEPKTQERIAHTLKTGKPLRN